MYRLKQGVTIFLSSEIEKILEVVCLVYNAFHIPVVITSGVDGPHREDSLHFKFRAIDIRKIFESPSIDAEWAIHRDLIFESLEHQFRIRKLQVAILNEQDHIHLEWIEK